MLAPHLRLRPCEPRDRATAIRLINHTFIYHNPLVVASKQPASTFDGFSSYLFDHCQPQGLSYVVEDTTKATYQPVNQSSDQSTNQSNDQSTSQSINQSTSQSINQSVDDPESDSVHDHDRHSAALANQSIVGVVLCLDKYNDADMKVLNRIYNWAPEEGVIWDNLNKHPVASQPIDQFIDRFEKHFDSLYQGLHVFLLSVNCSSPGQKIAKSLIDAVYERAQQLGYSYMFTDATHPATTHMFTRSPLNGRITHRLKGKDTSYTNKLGQVIRLYEHSEAEVCSISCRIDRKWKLTVNPVTVIVVKLHQISQSIIQSLMKSINQSDPNSFFSLTVANGERSLIIDESNFLSDILSIQTDDQSMRYRVLSIIGPLSSDLIGVLHQLLSLLKITQISVLTVSTYDTDHILVPETEIERAVTVMKQHGHSVDGLY